MMEKATAYAEAKAVASVKESALQIAKIAEQT